jgi:hypothetical protein
MTFIPLPGKVNYTQAKAYCPVSLLVFMQKMMQKLVTWNVKDETLGHDTYIYNNLPKHQVKSTETAMYQVITLIQEAVENKKLHLSFHRY